MPTPRLTFVHFSDTHIGPTPDFSHYGVNALACLGRLVDHFNSFPQQPDFFLHTGDLSNDRSAASYELAAPVLARLGAPLMLVNGNHDSPALLRSYFGAPPPLSGDLAGKLDYVFEVKGERFLVLDLQAEVEPQGHINEAQLDVLRAECTPDGPPLTLLIHYPLFPLDMGWLNANMLVDNGAALHDALLPARGRLRGVFHGHMHAGSHLVRDGITYSGGPGAAWQYGWRPWEVQPQGDADLPPAYNVVQYYDDYVYVRQYVVPPLSTAQ